MSAARGAAVATALLCAIAAAGCGLGSGETAGTAELTVTRGYGAEEILSVEDEVAEGETVLRLLDRHAGIETRYGGGFVQAIEGVEGGRPGGRPHDWFFYVNGVESPVGAAEAGVSDGDRIWWDHRDWGEAMRVSAVVGSFPQPFASGFEGREPRLLVGPWERLRSDRVAALLERGPAESGVFARPERVGGTWWLVLLDERGSEVARLGGGAGLIAALRPDGGVPTWVVTGTDLAGARAAVETLTEERLRDRYAVAIEPGAAAVSLPAEGAPVPAARGAAGR